MGHHHSLLAKHEMPFGTDPCWWMSCGDCLCGYLEFLWCWNFRWEVLNLVASLMTVGVVLWNNFGHRKNGETGEAWLSTSLSQAVCLFIDSFLYHVICQLGYYVKVLLKAVHDMPLTFVWSSRLATVCTIEVSFYSLYMVITSWKMLNTHAIWLIALYYSFVFKCKFTTSYSM